MISSVDICENIADNLSRRSRINFTASKDFSFVVLVVSVVFIRQILLESGFPTKGIRSLC